MLLPFTARRFSRFWLSAVFLLAASLWLPFSAEAANAEAAVDALPPNLGHSLRQLVVWHRTQPRSLSGPERRMQLKKSLPERASRVQTNAEATQAVVDVLLDGSRPLETVSESLGQLGVQVFARYDAHRPGSVLSARLPLDQAEAAARLPGVQSISLVHRAWRHVGQTTSEGVQALHTDEVNAAGFDGTGITVGVISDSFGVNRDEAGNPTRTTASQDESDGDLPVVKNLGDATVKSDHHNDEGRAMCQIIHDLAPGAQLVFHTAGETPVTMAEAIGILRSSFDGTNSSYYNTANCDIIVDDYSFPDEPMFSDGIIASQAELVGLSLFLPGKPAVYISSAGNNGDAAYAADFTPITDADARGGSGVGNLQLAQVPANLTAGGFHNFNPKPGKATIGQKVKLHGDAEISFQWDDPFIPGRVTTDYNLLVFDAQGNYLPDVSGTDSNITLGRAVEIVDLSVGDATSVTYQFAISRSADGTGAAKHLRYVVNGGDPIIKFGRYNQATTFGHNAGWNVIGVAAYAYNQLDQTESYSSLGPVTIYLDGLGNRLPTPEVRRQPAVAAVDGVNTTFFPPGALTNDDGTPNTDTDGDGFPNFFGTSAAAPHVAAVAALLLQAAGGPGSLTPAQVLALLQSTAVPHDLDPDFSSVTLSPPDGSTVVLSATADESAAASADKNGFHLAFDGPAGQSLKKVVINLDSTGLKFDPRPDLGYPFTIGTKTGLLPADVTGTLDSTNTTLTLNFLPGAFTAGRSLNFGIDRDLADDGTAGNSADLLAGASVKVRTKGGLGNGKAQGTLANLVGAGYSPAAGYGLVNALAALSALQTNPPRLTAAKPASGDILLTSSDNRIAEIRPSGAQVRLLPALPDPTNGTIDAVYRKYVQSAADAHGNIAVLYDAFTNYLIILDPKTGTTSTLTAPGWSGGTTLTATDHYVFATYGQKDFGHPRGTLLRFDTSNGAVQPFGTMFSNAVDEYSSLSIGPDGLLYALNNSFFQTPTPVDVYDPNTLTLVRSLALNLKVVNPEGAATVTEVAVGPAGEFYALSSNSFDDSTVYKFDANGQQIATLTLPNDPVGNKNLNSLSVNAQGAVLVGALDPFLIDPSFQTAKILYAFGVSKYTYPPTVRATFVP